MSEKAGAGGSSERERPDDEKPADEQPRPATTKRPVEIGGPAGPEPTRYGDWERRGRCSDF